ncbi:MAG: hypothetical protein ABR535_01125 [Pyrinomonadaceae bacterium]
MTDVASTRWADPNTNYRGNVTLTRTWHDIANNQYIDARAQYDTLGNLRNAWDGRGNLTQTQYSSAYDHAYPTSVLTPTPDTSGVHGSNVALTTSTVYDLVKQETERIDSRFLEPACGHENFLAAILERKLDVVERQYKLAKTFCIRSFYHVAHKERNTTTINTYVLILNYSF